MYRYLAMGLLPLLASGAAAAATLQVSPPKVADGVAAVTVRLLPGTNESVAGLQFDLVYDGRRMRYAAGQAGGVARAAEKMLHVNDKNPGRLRCVMAGFNQNAIAAGVVAEYRFDLGQGAGAAPPVTLENAVLSDPFGERIDVAVQMARTGSPPAIAATSKPAAGTPGKAPFPLLVAAGVLTAIVVAGGVRARRGGASR